MNDKPTEVKTEPIPPKDDFTKVSDHQLGYMDDLEYHRVADFLEVDYEDRKLPAVASKLSFLYDWAKEATKSDDRITRLEAIRGLQRSLGIQGQGLDTIKKLFQYARLDQNRRKIEREMDLVANVDTTPKEVVK